MMLQGGAVRGANCHLQCLEDVGGRGVENLFLFNRFSRWENHIATPKHLGTIVHNIESIPNMKLGKLELCRFLGVRRKRSEHFSCQWSPYSFQPLIWSPQKTAKSRMASADGCGISNNHLGWLLWSLEKYAKDARWDGSREVKKSKSQPYRHVMKLILWPSLEFTLEGTLAKSLRLMYVIPYNYTCRSRLIFNLYFSFTKDKITLQMLKCKLA